MARPVTVVARRPATANNVNFNLPN
jgi:hypothetical protein